ncbi:uncharacterized protein [Bemisia tabaci]|uniref:uncharacterized protein n=1 Tax=Bemisia tabaci TaxID=7038 RepID=UPI003B28D962
MKPADWHSSPSITRGSTNVLDGVSLDVASSLVLNRSNVPSFSPSTISPSENPSLTSYTPRMLPSPSATAHLPSGWRKWRKGWSEPCPFSARYGSLRTGTLRRRAGPAAMLATPPRSRLCLLSKHQHLYSH